MFILIHNADRATIEQQTALCEHFGIKSSLDWSYYKTPVALQNALEHPRKSIRAVVFTPLNLLECDHVFENLKNVDAVMSLTTALHDAHFTTGKTTGEELPTPAAPVDPGEPPMSDEDSKVLRQLTTKVALWLKSECNAETARQVIKNAGFSTLTEVQKVPSLYCVSKLMTACLAYEHTAAELKAMDVSAPLHVSEVSIHIDGDSAAITDAIRRNGPPSDRFNAALNTAIDQRIAVREAVLPEDPCTDTRTISPFHGHRIPVSLIDPDETELSELKKKFDDQKLTLMARQSQIESQLKQLDQLTHDLSALSKSNRELSDENEKLKTELNLKDGEIRNLVADGNLNEPGYHRLAKVLVAAYDQAARGKGKERHANDLPFHEQPMLSISELLGTPAGLAYQVCKKVQEAMNMPTLSQQTRELYGAINYTAGIVIYLENAEATAEGIARADSI